MKCKCGSQVFGPIAKPIKCPDCFRWNVPTVQTPVDHTFQRSELAEAEYITYLASVNREIPKALPFTHETVDIVLQHEKNLADDPEQMELLAERHAITCHELSRVSGLSQLEEYAARQGVVVNWASTTNVIGRIKRLCCAQWWKLQIRKTHWQQAENQERDDGNVSEVNGRYASFAAIKRRTIQNRTNQEKLMSTNLIAPDGKPTPLAIIAQHNTSDKTIRRHETMARVRGLDDYERKRGKACQFWTITAPSKYHATRIDGQPNKLYEGFTPKETNKYLLNVWATFRVYLHRQNIKVSGMRVAEPHHDGTPHHHYVIYMQKDQCEQLWNQFAAYARTEERQELKTDKLLKIRCNRINIDERGVTGYVLKYICKNLDGNTDSDVGDTDSVVSFDQDILSPDEQLNGIEAARRVDAWSSHNNIRQFAFFGAPSRIGIWRTLRSMEKTPRGTPEDIQLAHEHARSGDFESFIESSDGLALVSKCCGEISYYDENHVYRPHSVVNATGDELVLPVFNWVISLNQAFRSAVMQAKTIPKYTSDWTIEDIIDPVPF